MRKYRRPYQIKKKKSIFANRFFWLGILILIILGGIFYFIYFHSFFQLKVIEISGNQKVTAGDLENLVNEKISQKILFFPSKSIFLTNLHQIKKEILKKFPQIEEIHLKRKFPEILLLEIKEREPVAIFCFTSLSREVEGRGANCFFIDKAGIIFEQVSTSEFSKFRSGEQVSTSEFSEFRSGEHRLTESDLITLKKEIAREISLGERIIDKEQLFKILEVEAKLKNELKILSEEILVVSEERFDLKTSEGWQIYFNFKEDLNWQLTKLRAVLEKEISQEKRKDLEYIDLRFGNFAPYRYHQ